MSIGGSRGGAWGARPPPLFLDQTEVRRAEKMFFGDWASPFLRVWMTPPPPLLISRSRFATDELPA